MYLRKSNIRSHKLGVQKAHFSVSQFHWIWSHFFWCWFAYGWYSRSWSLGFGFCCVHSSKTSKHRELGIERSSAQWNSKHQHQDQNEETQTITRKLMNRPLWITLSQTQNLLTSKPSCTFWRQWSCDQKWSSKAEVRRWDTCPEPTELRQIGCLTESIWTLKSQSNMLTPRTNLLTWWPKVISRVMSGIIFSDCWTSWIFRCSPAANFFLIQKSQNHVEDFDAGEEKPGEETVLAKWKPVSLIRK